MIHCILAQAVTVAAADRTELRTRMQSSTLRFDAETRPSFRLALTTPHASFSFGYIPTVTALSIAVGGEGEIILQQAADLSAGYRWEHTSISVSQSGAYGTRNFRALSVAAPQPTGSSPTTPPVTPPGGTTGSDRDATTHGSPHDGAIPTLRPEHHLGLVPDDGDAAAGLLYPHLRHAGRRLRIRRRYRRAIGGVSSHS